LTTIFIPDNYKTKNLFDIIEYGYQGYINLKINDECNNYQNSVIISNYPSTFVNYTFLPFYLTSIGKKYKIVVGHGAKNIVSLFFDTDKLLILDEHNNYEKLKLKIIECIKDGVIPIVYPEHNFWTREHKKDIKKFRTGIFKICRDQNIGIISAVIGHIDHIYGLIVKNDIRINLSREDTHDAEVIRKKMQEQLNK
jgi:rRNA processing protein Gar1